MSHVDTEYSTLSSSHFVDAWNAYVWLKENTAVGMESDVIRNHCRGTVRHFFSPVSRQKTDPLLRFYLLKTEWEADTAHLSSMTQIITHPAYQQIIGMGPIAVRLILQELKGKPGHWFWALKSITGEDPVLPEDRGQIAKMTESWLSWGRRYGYLSE
jgi:hypothetical protein